VPVPVAVAVAVDVRDDTGRIEDEVEDEDDMLTGGIGLTEPETPPEEVVLDTAWRT